MWRKFQKSNNDGQKATQLGYQNGSGDQEDKAKFWSRDTECEKISHCCRTGKRESLIQGTSDL